MHLSLFTAIKEIVSRFQLTSSYLYRGQDKRTLTSQVQTTVLCNAMHQSSFTAHDEYVQSAGLIHSCKHKRWGNNVPIQPDRLCNASIPLTADDDEGITGLPGVIRMEGTVKEVCLTLMYLIKSIGLCNAPGTFLCRSGVSRGWLTSSY